MGQSAITNLGPNAYHGDSAACLVRDGLLIAAVGYGDRPNSIRLKELATRWDYEDATFANGIPETFSIDQSKHSLFGASKVAADVMVQEYGRYFGMKTCCLRGGCLTGPNHSGVELHGFSFQLSAFRFLKNAHPRPQRLPPGLRRLRPA